jgi:hypothetical protein
MNWSKLNSVSSARPKPWRALDHPDIVSIYDAGEANGLAYIAMAFLPGGDLVPQTKPAGLLPLTAVLSIVARVAEALDYAHSQQVVHRDIKPANIMYEPLKAIRSRLPISVSPVSPIRRGPRPAWCWGRRPSCRRSNWPASQDRWSFRSLFAGRHALSDVLRATAI